MKLVVEDAVEDAAAAAVVVMEGTGLEGLEGVVAVFKGAATLCRSACQATKGS